MPKGGPMIGRSFSARTSAAEELTEAPAPTMLGTIDTRRPTFDEDGPPPWEVDRGWEKHNTDARRFVDVPSNWELRWLSPRRVDQAGFRDWQAVPAKDERIHLKVPAMGAPDNTVRRGGHMGDFLAYMPKHWVESRKRIQAERNARRTQAAVDRQEQFKEEVRRGGFGPHVRVSDSRHPTHTIADGRTMDRE